MNILVTGAKGFVGRNLCLELKNIRDGKSKCWGILPRHAELDSASRHPWLRPEISPASLSIDQVFEYDLDSTPDELERYCKQADFVFNLAGVNRPQNQDEFMKGNFGFASTLLDTLKKYGNKCPVMLSSSQQASLTGRFGNSEYGRSKKAGEDLFLDYSKQTGAPVKIYRFPNLFGKWCRPNYNSAVATFCNNIANDLPIQVNDPSVELELLYIDDLIAEMIAALKGEEHRCEFNGLEVIPAEVRTDANHSRVYENGRYCYCPITHHVKLGEIVDLLYKFKEMPQTLMIPEIENGSFAKKLYSTYLSYLPADKAIFDLKMNQDARGSFTELLHTPKTGQVSINISKPGITKGEHWHHTKWEQFIVVKGHGLIRMRPENPRPDQIGPDGQPIIQEYEVTGDKLQSVIMLPGYTHNIINLSATEDLVTVMYCNEIFDPSHPDTYSDKVKQ